MSKRPKIILSTTDAEALSSLALRMEEHAPAVTTLLLDEIDRADVRPNAAMPKGVARMGSTVEFLDAANGQRRAVQLVWPAQADIAADRISILTPVGAGLIGLSKGQSIDWPDRAGHERRLTVLAVSPPLG